MPLNAMLVQLDRDTTMPHKRLSSANAKKLKKGSNLVSVFQPWKNLPEVRK